MELSKLHQQAITLENIMRLRTSILAVKMLEKASDIPADAERPMEQHKYHLDLCQALGKSRLEGMTIAMLKEDMWCFEPVVGLGLEEPSSEFLAGDNRYPWSVMKREDAIKWAHSLPRFGTGDFIGIVSAPLSSCTFNPDIFLIFCDPEQLTHLLIAKNCIDGEDLTCTLSGHAGCVYAIVPVIKEDKCNVVSPCRGFRSYAMTQREEIIFSCPIGEIEKYIAAYEHLGKNDWQYPYTRHIQPERRLKDNYQIIGETLGMNY